jgi:hypothetical protein
MIGRANEVPSKYLFSYTALALERGYMKSVMNSSVNIFDKNLACPALHRFGNKQFTIDSDPDLTCHSYNFAVIML